MEQETPSSRVGLNLPFVEESRTTMDRNEMPFAHRLNATARNHFVACCGEFIGTASFLLLGLSGAQVALLNNSSEDQISKILFISLAFGFSLAVNVWVMYRVSGGLFNPAVTAGMCLVGALPWARGLFLIGTQFVSAIVSSLVVHAVFPGPIALTQLNLASGINPLQGFLIELFLTYQFVLSIMMMAGEKNAATPLAPVGIGLSLFAAELSGVYFTGGSLNPARSFGPAVAVWDFSGHHWVYWAGPFGGAILAACTHKFLKILEYEKANPGQDGDSDPKSGGIRLGDD